MKKFFEQMIMDSVTAVKDELLARLRESGKNFKDQYDNPIYQEKLNECSIQNSRPSQQPSPNYAYHEPKVTNAQTNAEQREEFPIVAYPDQHSTDNSDYTDTTNLYHNAIADDTNTASHNQNLLHSDYEKTDDTNYTSEPNQRISNDDNNFSENFEQNVCGGDMPIFHRNFLVNKNHFVDEEHKICMLNAYNKNRRLNIMILGAVFGLVFCLLMLTFYKGDLPGEVVGIISTVSGIFGSCLKDAYSFEFGSSRGSKEKDDKITSTLLKKLKI